MKTLRNIILVVLLAVFGFLYSCQTQGELLWIKKTKKGKPPIFVSNYFAKSNELGTVFPRYKLSIGRCNVRIIYYKNITIYNSNLFPQFENESVELYKNSILLITEMKSNDVPMTIWRKETLFIELDDPKYYYLVKFENPINIISSEVVEIIIKSQNKKTIKSELIPTKTSYNFYTIKELDLEKQTILLKKINVEQGIYKLGEEQEDLKLELDKYKNPVFE